ncbi:MAG: alpha/beta hydrolase [Actinomycetia bacterium]|nr:alpha/beta hydrolase [Actinomycetes bacterium]
MSGDANRLMTPARYVATSARSATALLALLTLISAACGGSTSETSATTAAETPVVSESASDDSSPAPSTALEPVETDVDYGAEPADGYSSEPLLDVWAAATADGPPVLILLDGLPPTRQSTAGMASALADRGFVVLNADWQIDTSLTTGVHYHGACLVRFARANALSYGGDPTQVVMVGYSAGGSIAALLALNGDAINGQCDQDESLSSVPDAIVGLAGGYEYMALDSPEPGFGEEVFAADPELWEMMNPYEHLDEAAGLRALLIHGEDDMVVTAGSSERFAAALEERDAEVTVHILEGAGHALLGARLDEVVDKMVAWLSTA